MQAILKPISHPELGEVTFDDTLLCVGREGEVFAGLGEKHAGRLSRRHARLFEQDGVIYIVDLGSRNGTSVNGRPVATQPQRLKPGDLIAFADEFTYRLDVIGEPDRAAAGHTPPCTLHLEVASPGDGPDSLVVTAFPFLISKQADAFAQYRQRAPAELDYLSRRHAHIFRHEGRLFVEDLGSTNGTFVDADRLGDKAVELRDGQTLAFGGDYFVYRVRLERDQAGTRILAAPPTADAAAAADKTTFVTAATSFLDIFCAEEAAPDAPPGQAPEAGTAVAEPAGRRRGPVGRLLAAASLRDRPLSRQKGLMGLLLALVLAAGAYWLMQPSPSDRIRTLIEEERFDEALALVRAHGEVTDSDALVSRLGLRALVAKTLPGWLDALDDGKFTAVVDIVEAERVLGDPLTAAGDYLGLLAIIGEIQTVVERRGGLDAPLRLFDEEPAQLALLVDVWESPDLDKRQVTERLLAVLPPAQADLAGRYLAAYRRAASQVRALEAKLAVYRPAQEQVTRLVRTQLAQDNVDRLAADLDRLAARYGQLAGFESLRNDLDQYRAIVDAIRKGRETEAARLAANATFQAEPFAEAAARLAQEQLPSASFLDAYAEALDLWRAGRADAARVRLQALLDTPWKPVAQRELDRMQQVAAGFAQLNTLRGGDAYDDRLLAFYQTLDGDRDGYYLQSLQDEQARARERVVERAHLAAAAAAQAWADYQSQGGINSTQRLESRIRTDYAQRAVALSNAAEQAARASRAYALAQAGAPDGERGLLAAIPQEVALQHQSLDELQGVLDDRVLQKKRALLPERSQ